jgi:hypothetical protein
MCSHCSHCSDIYQAASNGHKECFTSFVPFYLDLASKYNVLLLSFALWLQFVLPLWIEMSYTTPVQFLVEYLLEYLFLLSKTKDFIYLSYKILQLTIFLLQHLYYIYRLVMFQLNILMYSKDIEMFAWICANYSSSFFLVPVTWLRPSQRMAQSIHRLRFPLSPDLQYVNVTEWFQLAYQEQSMFILNEIEFYFMKERKEDETKLYQFIQNQTCLQHSLWISDILNKVQIKNEEWTIDPNSKLFCKLLWIAWRHKRETHKIYFQHTQLVSTTT